MFEYPEVKEIQAGAFRIGHDEYHQGAGVSSSVLKRILRSPAHAMVEREDSPSLAFGRAFHMSILEPRLFSKHYTVAPKFDRRTKVGKAEYAVWLEKNANKEVISADDWETISAMTRSVKASKFWKRIKNYDVEIAHATVHEGTGQLIKCKADMIGDWVIDFKSTIDASGDSFARSAIKYGYHTSAAFYQDIIEKVTGRVLPFMWIAVEKTAPYGVAFYNVDPAMIEAGREDYKRALDIYAKCATADKWPAYPDEIQELPIPGWFWNKG